MEADHAAWERLSTVCVVPPAAARSLAKVPFVELAEGRVQGVVSSGSDSRRVYVSSIAAGSHNFTCSTNNNRPCGGLRGSGCNHLLTLLTEAVVQYGAERVTRYLRVDAGAGESTGAQLFRLLHGRPEPGPAAPVFSRFLRHLTYLELPVCAGPVDELHWFPATGARG